MLQTENMTKYWIWLNQIKGLGPVLSRKLLERFSTPEGIFHAVKAELMSIPGIGSSLADEIIESRSPASFDVITKNILEKMDRYKIKILTVADSYYPQMVKSLPKAPVVLYYKGKLLPDNMGVGLIGTRRCTEYGKKVTKEAATFLAEYNIPVISGLAKGIDSYAHTACLKAGGYTIAFLGCGVDICYPKEHKELMEEIIKHGAVISEYPPGTTVKKEHFPKRNFLISAWSHKLLVVEAGGKSGALITAQYAKEIGREILAVPNSIYIKESLGTNKLIENGAKIYLKPNQLLLGILTEIKLNSTSAPKSTHKNFPAPSSPLEEAIISLLLDSKDYTQELEKLMISFSGNRTKLLETISIMEIEGKIKTLPNGRIKIIQS